jgi:hypothetical protein
MTKALLSKMSAESINMVSRDGHTALNLATNERWFNSELVGALLAAGADPSIGIFHPGDDPFMIGMERIITILNDPASRPHQVFVDAVIKKACIVDAYVEAFFAALKKGGNVLRVSGCKTAEELMKKALSFPNSLGYALEAVRMGVDVNTRGDKYGETALHLAAHAKSVKAVELLIEKGADVNAVDARGETPLYHSLSTIYAPPEVNVQIVAMLVAKMTAEAIAQENDSQITVHKLLNHRLVYSIERSQKLEIRRIIDDRLASLKDIAGECSNNCVKIT